MICRPKDFKKIIRNRLKKINNNIQNCKEEQLKCYDLVVSLIPSRLTPTKSTKKLRNLKVKFTLKKLKRSYWLPE